jgi:ribosomal protein S12
MKNRFAFVVSVFGVMLVATSLPALAQQPGRVRGVLEAVDGPTLTVKSRAGETVKIRVPNEALVAAFVKASVADIKPNSFVGVTSIPAPDGSEKAYEVHIFPEERRGFGEGRRAWDLTPQSKMTNGAVTLQSSGGGEASAKVSSVQGQELTIKYKGGDAKVSLTPETIIVAYAPGDRSELKPGTQVVVVTKKADDGSLEATAVTYGRDGVIPPT